MKKFIFSFGILLFIFPNVNSLQAQNKTGSKNWTVNPFEEKVFVENKTQFDGQNNLPNSRILFGVRNDGVQIYFTNKGLTYRHDEFVPMSEAEKEKAEKDAAKLGRKMDADMMRKKKTDCINMQWENANPNVQVITEDEVSNYFTYPDLRDKSGKTTIKAFAYKKIIYKNLYPNIDVEYSFPENKTGIKYSIILHPGADVSEVKMQYSENGKINLDANGNAEINSNFGNIIDHAPKTNYENGNAISSKFTSTKNTVSFALQNYDHEQTVIIDPWVTVPSYTTGSPYDVDADLAGNVYIYGGTTPYQEIKLNSIGLVLWTYTAVGFDPYGFYGDFAVDGHSQNSYLVEGFMGSYPSRILKISSLGFQLAISIGNPALNEMWRITFNNTTRTGVIGAGGTAGTYQACVLDTTLSSTTPVNILGATNVAYDICLMAQDNNNNCYMAVAYNLGDATSNNFLFKSPIPALLPTSFIKADGCNFIEIASVTYTGGYITNGFNGMAVNNNFLYSYNGSVLKKWDSSTGVLLGTTVVTGIPFKWGGLQVDDCNNIFAGAINKIKQYDGNLNLVNTIAATDTIYDLKLGTNLLYSCGKGFVQSIQLSLPPCDSLRLTMTSTNACFSDSNTANVTAEGGTGIYTYSWSTNPTQITATATGLSPGTYYVTVTNTSCVPSTQKDSITITSPLQPNASFIANPSTGVSPLQVNFTNTSSGATNYEWNLGNGDTTNLFNTNTTYQNPGQYTVELIVTNAYGCSDTAYATIDVEQKSILIIPNVFSPNGDGKNDVFKVESSGIFTFDAKIFDRWGIQLFEWTDPNSGWNGETKTGANAPDGTYYYLINATGIDGKKYLEKGFLTLVR